MAAMIEHAYQRALAAFELGQYDLCERALRDGLRDDPNDTDLIALLGHVKLVRDDYTAARALAQNAIDLDPEDSRGFSILAWATISDPTYSPGNPGYRYLADDTAKAQISRVTTGRELAERCLELDPMVPGYYALLAEIEFLGDVPTEALNAANRGLAIEPSHPGSTYARMRALGDLGRLPEAIQTGLYRLQFHAEDANCHHRLAQLYLESRDIASATRHARQAVRLDPSEQSHRETYWDAIKARNPVLRPFIYWQFIAKRLERVPENLKIACLIAVSALAGLLAGLVEDRFAFEGAPLMVMIVVGAGALLLASERPCITLVDLFMYITDPDYRATVEKKKMLTDGTISIGAIAAIVCLLLASLSIYGPLVVLVFSVFFVPSVACFIDSRTLGVQLLFVANMMVMAGLLAVTVFLFRGSIPGSSERMASMYVFMAFVAASLTGPVLYAQARQRHRVGPGN